MPVVINDFEVVTETPPPRGAAAPETGAAPEPAETPDPKDVAPLLRALQTQALRAWAH